MDIESLTVLDKIGVAFEILMKEGISPSLLLINKNDERKLFTEGSIPKSESAEDFLLDRFKVEVFVLPINQITEPEFYGKHRLPECQA